MPRYYEMEVRVHGVFFFEGSSNDGTTRNYLTERYVMVCSSFEKAVETADLLLLNLVDKAKILGSLDDVLKPNRAVMLARTEVLEQLGLEQIPE